MFSAAVGGRSWTLHDATCESYAAYPVEEHSGGLASLLWVEGPMDSDV